MLRKKWISLLVAISMVAAMFPATVFADTVEATEPVEPQTSVTETAQDEKDPVEEVGQLPAAVPRFRALQLGRIVQVVLLNRVIRRRITHVPGKRPV